MVSLSLNCPRVDEIQAVTVVYYMERTGHAVLVRQNV